jgi:hypothetical protein
MDKVQKPVILTTTTSTAVWKLTIAETLGLTVCGRDMVHTNSHTSDMSATEEREITEEQQGTQIV